MTVISNSGTLRQVRYEVIPSLENQYLLWCPDEPLGVFVSAGKCISHFTNRKVPYCVKFHPDEEKQNLFVAGMSDKKIVQVTSAGVNHLRVNHVQQECVQLCVEKVLEGVSIHCRLLPAFKHIFLCDSPHPFTLQ